MPRKPRYNQISGYYHVMSQGINKEYIFQKKLYIEKYKELMLKKSKDLNINILSYCIMSNHVHILINTNKISDLSKYMQKLNTTYSSFYNKANRRVGYVFRDRFLSQEILSESQLLYCIRYIHYNPVKAGIVKFAGDYKYSSYNEFIGKRNIINDNCIKIVFGDFNNYKKIFYELHNIDNEIHGESFIDIKDKKIEEYIKYVETKYKLPANKIKTNKKLLEKVIKDSRETTEATVRELAQILEVSKSTISNYEKK